MRPTPTDERASAGQPERSNLYWYVTADVKAWYALINPKFSPDAVNGRG
jgi:hypothetical protein